MDFIFMLTRHDRTVEDALDLVDAVCEQGVTHLGFKDIGVSRDTMQRLVDRIRQHGATTYLEVVSTTPESVRSSLATAGELRVDCVLGGTDIATARATLGSLAGYFPFPGRPQGHPTQLRGTPELVAQDCARARDAGCGGVDLLAYRATEADPLALVRSARAALPDRRLIVAGSVTSEKQIRALAEAGADAFTIGSAVFEGAFSPAKGALQSQLRDILAASDRAGRSVAGAAA